MILCFDSFFRLNAQFVFIAVILSPFYILSYFTFAVILFRFICSHLSNLPLQRNQCYHHVIQSRAFSVFQCFPARVAICPDKSLLSVGWNVGVVFTFTTAERRLLLKKVSFKAHWLFFGQIVNFRANFFLLPSKMPSSTPMLTLKPLW